MGGRNNQPKVIRNDAICFRETARRAMTIGEAAAASFGPSNYWTKKKSRNVYAAILYCNTHIATCNMRAICVHCDAMDSFLLNQKGLVDIYIA